MEILREDPHGFDVINGVAREEEQSPAAADTASSDQPILLALLEGDATDEQEQCREIRNASLAERAKRAQFMNAEKSDANDEDDDSEFVEPVGAERLLDGGHGLQALLKRRPRSRALRRSNVKSRDRQGSGDSRRES